MERRIAILLLLLPLLLQCKRKDEVLTTDPSARLSFSERVVVYDTLFADLTYPSHRIKVYNPNEGALAISEVSLFGGSSSHFTILVNGQQGPVVRDLELIGGDSMLIVIGVFFDSTSTNAPYLIEDSIRFVFNGQEQHVLLKAVGRDAKLIPAGNLNCSTVWDNTKPIVLLGQTVIAPGCSLTIQKGTQVFASRGSSLDIKGTLIVTGEKNDSVFFGGLSSGKNPGQWLGLRFYEGSSGNTLSWFNIENAVTGLSFDYTTTPVTLVDITMDHGTFHDFTQSAVDVSYTTLTATNCLFHASSDAATKLSQSGSADFRYCSWAGYSYDYYRQGPSIEVSDVSGVLSLSLKHSIVWGDMFSEISIDPAAIVSADTCIIKRTSALLGTGTLLNQDPRFNLPVTRDFQLKSTSPAIDKGVPSVVIDDLKGVLRDALPDLGCYEYKP
ncbi:MAG: hypothetical protein JWO58_113 [Chitinophagaceae bacterium]|nr:hypothetical protein [Chitinophagaceae bacterium]